MIVASWSASAVPPGAVPTSAEAPGASVGTASLSPATPLAADPGLPSAPPGPAGLPLPWPPSVAPVLPSLGAPGWVRAGVRVSYYSAVANVLSASERFILDENGDWVGQTTGNRYRREELYGAAGHGVTQVDVLSVGAETAVLQVNSWQYSVYTGPLVPNGQAPWIGPASGGDWYLHPAALADVANQRTQGITILRMPYTIGGVTYSAIRFQQQSDRATFARMYDLEDGKMLASFGAVTSQQGTLCSEAIFLGVRRMNLPWLGHRLPGWVGPGKVLAYQGTKSWEAIRAGTVLTADVSVRMTIDQASADAFTYTRSVSAKVRGYASQQTKENLAGGVGEPTSIAVPVAALDALRSGQTIDRDPITSITVKVTDRRRQSGRDLVVIEARNQGYSARLTYDAGSGAMVAFSDVVTSEETRQYTDLRLT